jgi:NTE family protein
MYRRIYLCGGGMVGICNVGVLQELDARGYLPLIKEYIGISSGALQALIFASGYTLAQGFEILKMDFQQVTEPDFAPGWLLNMGYDTGNRLLRFVQALLRERGLKELITFQELFQATGRSFRTFATNMNLASLVEFSKEKTPHYPVAYAARASMSLPYYFQPFKCPLTSILYGDGGCITNFPLSYLTEEEREETLAVNIPYSPDPNPSIELQDYLMRPLQIFLGARSQENSDRYPSQTVVIQGVKSQPINFGMELDEKMDLVAKGRLATKEFFQKYRKPVRRYSVS